MASCDVASALLSALAGPMHRYCNAACQQAHWNDPTDPHKAHCSGCAYDEEAFETKKDAQIFRNAAEAASKRV